jgi:hypothetical protein
MIPTQLTKEADKDEDEATDDPPVVEDHTARRLKDRYGEPERGE